jgi:hypothetical protein
MESSVSNGDPHASTRIQIVTPVMENKSTPCRTSALCTMDIDATASIPKTGFSLADGKAFLSRIQTEIVSAQIAAINVQRRGGRCVNLSDASKTITMSTFAACLAKSACAFPVFNRPPVIVLLRQKHRPSANGEFQQNLSSYKANCLPRCLMPGRRRFLACCCRWPPGMRSAPFGNTY